MGMVLLISDSELTKNGAVPIFPKGQRQTPCSFNTKSHDSGARLQHPGDCRGSGLMASCYYKLFVSSLATILVL